MNSILHAEVLPSEHKLRRLCNSGIELQYGMNVSSYELPPHFHDDYQFMLVDTGAREISFRNDKRVFGSGYLTIVNPGDIHSTRCHGEFGSSFKTMHLPVSIWANELESEYASVMEPLFRFEMYDSYLLRVFRRLHERIDNDGCTLETDELLADLLHVALTSNRLISKRKCRFRGIEDKLQTVRDYIQDNFAMTISLADLANLVGLSKYHLNREFCRSIGMPPHAFQIRVRVNRAKTMLSAGFAIKRVAAAVGFADSSHFGKHFIRVVGFTPRQYQLAVGAIIV